MPRARFALALLASTLVVVPAVSGANGTYPERTVRLVAPQEPGSATDKVARILADALGKQLAQPVIVENKPGAGGTIGAESVARAAPDGYTLLIGGYSNLVAATAIRNDVRYDVLKDFQPIGRFAAVPFAFAVHPSVPAATLPELVALARAQPGKLNVGSLGGGATGVGTALFVQDTGVVLTPIEYKGASSAITDLVAGRIDVLFNEIGALGPLAEGGRVRLLAVATPTRIAAAPAVPTVAEAGLPALVVAPWYGLVAPAGLPPEVAAKLTDAFVAARRSPELRARIATLGYEVIDDDAAAFAGQIARDLRTATAVLPRQPAK